MSDTVLTLLVAGSCIFGSLGVALVACWMFDMWESVIGLWVAALILGWTGFGLLAGAAGWTLP